MKTNEKLAEIRDQINSILSKPEGDDQREHEIRLVVGEMLEFAITCEDVHPADTWAEFGEYLEKTVASDDRYDKHAARKAGDALEQMAYI